MSRATAGARAPLSDAELADAWHLLMTRYHRVTCRLDRELEDRHGISASEFEILQQLAGAKEPVALRGLGEHAHLSQSALSRAISRLEGHGMVSRNACGYDRRSVLACITPAGRKIFTAARRTQRSVLRDEVLASD